MSWSVELRLVAANVNPQPAEYALFTVMVDGAIGTTPALCEDCGRMELLLDMEPRTAPRLIHKHGIPAASRSGKTSACGSSSSPDGVAA